MLLLLTLMFYYGNNYNPEIQVTSGMTVNSAAAITIPSLMNGPRAGINVGKFKKRCWCLACAQQPLTTFLPHIFIASNKALVLQGFIQRATIFLPFIPIFSSGLLCATRFLCSDIDRHKKTVNFYYIFFLYNCVVADLSSFDHNTLYKAI